MQFLIKYSFTNSSLIFLPFSVKDSGKIGTFPVVIYLIKVNNENTSKSVK